MSNVSDGRQEPELALRFIEGKYEGIDYPVLPRREIRVGRAAGLELVLADELVSRQHARISTVEGELTVVDLGSTNGTIVNGTRVARARLAKGDRVLIGRSVMEVVAAEDSRSTLSKVEASLIERASPRERTTAPSSEEATSPDVTHGGVHFQGSLEEVPVHELLQILAHLKRTGVLCLFGKGVAQVHLREGAVHYVSIEGLRLPAVKAVFRVFGWRQGTFDFQPGPPQSFEGAIEIGNNALILEAFRHMDEMERLSPRLPAPENRLALSSPIAPRLRDLSGVELEVLWAVSRFGRLAEVLDECSANDVDVCTHLTSLIERGYVRLEQRDSAAMAVNHAEPSRDLSSTTTEQSSHASSFESLERPVVGRGRAASIFIASAVAVALVCTGVYLATHKRAAATDVADNAEAPAFREEIKNAPAQRESPPTLPDRSAVRPPPLPPGPENLEGKKSPARLRDRKTKTGAGRNKNAQVAAHLRRASKFMLARDYTQAIASYRRALDVDPQNPFARQGLAEATRLQAQRRSRRTIPRRFTLTDPAPPPPPPSP